MQETSSGKIQGEERKPYEAPALRVYGDIRNITGAVNDMALVADGGGGMTTKS